MSSEPVFVYEARLDDRDAIARIHRATFGGDAEANLVDQLRSADLIVASIVASARGEIVGNAVFSKLSVHSKDDRVLSTVALAPVAVLPEFQRRGFGSSMIETGLKVCADRGCHAAFVLGDPGYYGRFGFSTALTGGLDSTYKGPHWMALELVSGALAGRSGIVEYPEAFAAVD